MLKTLLFIFEKYSTKIINEIKAENANGNTKSLKNFIKLYKS